MADKDVVAQLCQLTKAKTLRQLCDLTYQILGNPVFVADMAHTILAYTQNVTVEHPSWQENVVSANLEKNSLKQDQQVGYVHQLSTQSLHPVLVEDDDLPYPRIIQTLVYKGQAVGVMVVTAYLTPFGEKDRELVELIASFVLPCFLRERYHVSNDKRGVENYFIQLLGGAQFSRERVQKRLDVLGYQQQPYSYVLAMSVREEEELERISLEVVEQEIGGIRRSRVFLYGGLLVCVFGSDTPVTEWETQLPELELVMRRWKLIAGVSRRIEQFNRLQEYYTQAREILEIGRKLGRHHDFYLYDSLSSFLLFDRIPREELEKYCHQQIRELARYDGEHGTDLCATLQIYLEQAKSLSRTAEIIFVHRNTVRYRINRCMELLNNRLEDGNEIFAFILSLRILEYQSKILNILPPQNPFGERNGKEE